VIREQLRKRGVTIDDRTKMWAAEDGRKGVIGSDAPMEGRAADDATLQKMLTEREAARKARDYGASDRIRDELHAMGALRALPSALLVVASGMRGMGRRGVDGRPDEGLVDDRWPTGAHAWRRAPTTVRGGNAGRRNDGRAAGDGSTDAGSDGRCALCSYRLSAAIYFACLLCPMRMWPASGSGLGWR
jgi:hypothetical protein